MDSLTNMTPLLLFIITMRKYNTYCLSAMSVYYYHPKHIRDKYNGTEFPYSLRLKPLRASYSIVPGSKQYKMQSGLVLCASSGRY